MSNIAIVGCNWGDEGKGRMVDYFAQNADAVIRFQGGNNAGHTVINDFGEFKLHLLPSGVFNPNTLNILGTGMVINLEALFQELQELTLPHQAQIAISERATICFPFHKLQDQLEEKRLGKNAFGSTQQGIAPCYADRNAKVGIQVGDARRPDILLEKLNRLAEYKNSISEALYGQKLIHDVQGLVTWATDYYQKLSPYIFNEHHISQLLKNKKIVFEAQLGALRDVNMGIYPFTTSSPVLSSYAAYGSGLPDLSVNSVIGVTKAFSTCVGAGPFVTEMNPEEATQLREKAFEFGATTSRPRRIGHFDAVATRFGTEIQNCDEIALTKLDCLSGRNNLKICTHYELNEKGIQYFPLNNELYECKPIYKEMRGWSENINDVRHWKYLPNNAKKYIEEIEELIEVRISYVSVGPERSALIKR